MDSLPREFLLLLLFAAVLVVNALLRRRKPRAEEEPDIALAGETAEAEREIGTPFALAPRAPAPVAARPAPAPRLRRFDRRNLLGSTRQVQDAFVVATILGRCRADEPHEPHEPR